MAKATKTAPKAPKTADTHKDTVDPVPAAPKTSKAATSKKSVPGPERPTLEHHVQGVCDSLKGMGKADVRHYEIARGLIIQDVASGRIDTKLTGKDLESVIDKILKNNLGDSK